MAGYKGHIAGGVGAGVVYGLVLLPFAASFGLPVHSLLPGDWQLALGLLVICILFSLWPDVDTNSKGQDIFFGLAFVSDILLIWGGYLQAAAFLGLIAMTPIVGKHRGWTHSKIAMMVVPLPLLIVPSIYRPSLSYVALLLYGAAVAGYFSHLLLDGCIVRWIRIKA